MEPIMSSTSKPIDYIQEYDRGTVDFKQEWRNYSYHKVVIPDNTIITNCNFSQIQPKTDCIIGKNLTFINCNLCNVLINPTWTLKECNTIQSWLVDENGVETRRYVSSHPDDIGSIIKPVDAITQKL